MGQSIRVILAGAAALLLGACATITPVPTSPSLDAVETALARDIATLASDDFAGRYPGTIGEAKTAGWFVQRFSDMGLQGGAGEDDWTQEFTLVRRTARTEPGATVASATRGQRSIAFSDRVLGGHSGIDKPELSNIPMVGIDPDLDRLRPGSLANRALVLPAAELARRGSQLEAARPKVVLLTADSDEAYEQAARLFERGRWQLESDTGGPALMLLSPQDSEKLTGLVGVNASRHPDGLGVVSYDTILDATIAQGVERIETANFVGRLPGSVVGVGAVLVLAHWDHLGDACGPPDATDRLCNGAVDNASGLAVMAEAVALATREGPLDRDLIVLGSSAEELGLLGAEAFVAEAPVPLPTIAAAFNIDTIAVAGRGQPVVILGAGETPLDFGISEVARTLGRDVVPSDLQAQFLRRQDGWVFLREGVPAVLVGGSLADEDAFQSFLRGPYHGADDEFSDDLELGGAAEDTLLHAALLRYFGSLSKYPGGAN